MDRIEQEKNTLDYYNQHALEFTAFRGEGVSRYWDKELTRFKELLPKGIVLEVGCGIGNEAVLLTGMGYDYVGTDISTGMLAVAKSRLPEGNFVCQDLRKPGFGFKFDGLISIATLLHLEKYELTPTLGTLKDQLRSGGIGLLTLKEGVGREVDGKGRFYSYYSKEELAHYILKSGFNLLDITIHEDKVRNFICCFVENPKP